MSWYQKGKTNLDFTEARDSEWQWHQLGHMQVSTLLQTDNHTSTPPLSFLQAGCPSYRPTNSVKALVCICFSLKTFSVWCYTKVKSENLVLANQINSGLNKRQREAHCWLDNRKCKMSIWPEKQAHNSQF